MPLSWIGSGTAASRPLILVAEELLIVGLVITRRGSTAQSRSLWDWAVALIGTGAPLLLRPGLALPGLTPIGRGRKRILLEIASAAGRELLPAGVGECEIERRQLRAGE